MNWYDLREEALGNRFINAVQKRFDSICENPTMPRLILRSVVRKVSIHGFPYLIYYRVVDGEARVIAVIHTSRDPHYISSRLTE